MAGGDSDLQRARRYLQRAESYGLLMNIGHHDVDARDAVALLAIHLAVAVGDAALVALQGKTHKGQDHAEAARVLEKQCGRAGRDASGLKHLRLLIDRKSAYSYGDRRVDPKQAGQCVIAAGRSLAWFYRTFPEVAGSETDDE